MEDKTFDQSCAKRSSLNRSILASLKIPSRYSFRFALRLAQGEKVENWKVIGDLGHQDNRSIGGTVRIRNNMVDNSSRGECASSGLSN